MGHFDPFVKVSLAGFIFRDEAAKFIDDFYRLSADVDANVLCCFSGGRLDEDLCLFGIDLHPKGCIGLVIQVCRPLAVNDNLGRSCVVDSILKLSHAGGGNYRTQVVVCENEFFSDARRISPDFFLL